MKTGGEPRLVNMVNDTRGALNVGFVQIAKETSVDVGTLNVSKRSNFQVAS